MKALVASGNGKASVEDIEKPVEGTLVKTLRVGIDGTDREVLEEAEERFPDGEDSIVMGHEVVGRVVESEMLEEGALVVPTVRRPTCNCQHALNGRPDFCPVDHYVERGVSGAHGFCAEFFAEENPDYLVPIPEELEEIGVLVEPTSIVDKAVTEVFKVQQRMEWYPENALVLGAGSIGLLGSMLLRKKGLEVTAVDVVDRGHPKTDILDSIGAGYVDNRETGIDELAEFDIILESSGVSEQVFKGMGALDENGVLVSLGLPMDESVTAEVPVAKLHEELVLRNKTVIGSVNSSVPHFEHAIGHLQYFQENFAVERILDLQVGLEDWEDAFDEPDIKGEIVLE